MRTRGLDRLLFVAFVMPVIACASDLDLNLAGRPCLNGACLRGFECVDRVCVPESGWTGDGVAMADSGGLVVGKDSDVPFPGGAWVGGQLRDAGDPPVKKPDASTPSDPPVIDAGPVGGMGGSGGVQASGGGGGVQTSGGGGGVQASGGTGGSEPPPPPACTPEEQCNNTCVDRSSDPSHCGRCHHACASVELCVDGACRAECMPDPDIEIDVELDLDGEDDAGCPEACDACVDGTCELRCATEQACKEREVQCPEGFACVVHCDAKQACEKLDLQCAPAQLCSLRCNGEQACKDAKVECGGAHCEALCLSGDDACEHTALHCGPGACGAVCGAGQRKPDIHDCMRSCSTGCGCE